MLLLAGALITSLVMGMVGTLVAGSLLAAPSPADIGPPPRDLHVESVEFPSNSGCLLKGWLIHGVMGRGAIVLMHGIHANRLAMVPRARFLANAGYTVLLFDFQSHGQSAGRHQTFGYLESRDARAAVRFLESRAPGEKIGAIGSSLGGAAAILGSEPFDVRALVLEAVYPTVEEATSNRIAERLGAAGRCLTPLLLWQLRPRLGVSVSDLRPIDRIGTVKEPILLIAGGRDVDTTPAESRRLFEAAHDPKEYWEIPAAGHQDFHACAGREYETRIVTFFDRYLRAEEPSPASAH